MVILLIAALRENLGHRTNWLSFSNIQGKLLNCHDKKFLLKSTPNLTNKSHFIEEIVTQCFPSYKLITNRELTESLTSSIGSTNSNSDYSILRCYEIFYVQVKGANQKQLYSSPEKVSNEDKFSVGNHCLSSLDLIQARRLGKKIAQTIR